jgi:hypothetical protein
MDRFPGCHLAPGMHPLNPLPQLPLIPLTPHLFDWQFLGLEVTVKLSQLNETDVRHPRLRFWLRFRGVFFVLLAL